MSELDSLGLGPSVLQSLHERGNPGDGLTHFEEQDGNSALTTGSYKYTIVYEIALNSSALEPRLRLSSNRCPPDVGPTHSAAQPIYHVDLLIPDQSLGHITRALLHHPIMFEDKTLLLGESMELYASAVFWSHANLTAIFQWPFPRFDHPSALRDCILSGPDVYPVFALWPLGHPVQQLQFCSYKPCCIDIFDGSSGIILCSPFILSLFHHCP